MGQNRVKSSYGTPQGHLPFQNFHIFTSKVLKRREGESPQILIQEIANYKRLNFTSKQNFLALDIVQIIVLRLLLLISSWQTNPPKKGEKKHIGFEFRVQGRYIYHFLGDVRVSNFMPNFQQKIAISMSCAKFCYWA